MTLNITKHTYKITKSSREQQHGHKTYLIWFTGLSGSGKSTLAHSVEGKLHQNGYRTFVLDGDTELRAVEAKLAKAEADVDGNAMAELHGRMAEFRH